MRTCSGARAGEHALGARAGAHALGASAGAHALGAGAGAHALGASAGAHALGAGAGAHALGASAGALAHTVVMLSTTTTNTSHNQSEGSTISVMTTHDEMEVLHPINVEHGRIVSPPALK